MKCEHFWQFSVYYAFIFDRMGVHISFGIAIEVTRRRKNETLLPRYASKDR